MHEAWSLRGGGEPCGSTLTSEIAPVRLGAGARKGGYLASTVTLTILPVKALLVCG